MISGQEKTILATDNCNWQPHMKTQINNFTLDFAAGGKLRQLSVDGIPLLHEGTHQLPIGDGKSFTVAGWDECFPTIEAFEDSPVMGQLISAVPTTVIDQDEAVQTWTFPTLTATRRFERGDARDELLIRFEAQNTSSQPRRYLWASHALFSLEAVTAIVLPQRTLTDLGLNNTSSKSFLPNRGPVEILRPNLTITLTTDQPWWGIWRNQGGWPAAAPAGFRCIGLEPTTTNADHPADASLAPGEIFHGEMRLHARAAPKGADPPKGGSRLFLPDASARFDGAPGFYSSPQ
jgi:hypothetical protein